jgi:hypothetical protein
LNQLLEVIRSDGSKEAIAAQIDADIRSKRDWSGESNASIIHTDLESARMMIRDLDGNSVPPIRSEQASVGSIGSWQNHFSDTSDSGKAVAASTEPARRTKISVMDLLEKSDTNQTAIATKLEPIYQVPASPWTTVTDDSEVVSHLISLWMTWYQPFFYFFEPNLFLRDMRAGNGKHCSPLLVNALLAITCVSRDVQ